MHPGAPKDSRIALICRDLTVMNSLSRRVALLIQRQLSGFDNAAAPYIGAKHVDVRAPIFLIGAPRTGSTLLFQLVVRQFRVAYISNVMAAAPRFMVRICRLSRQACAGFTGQVRNSQFGFVPGLWGPNEAGQLMRHWFGEAANDADIPLVRAMVAAIAESADAPLLLKNQANTLRLGRIRQTFPSARLVLVRRDLRWTAQSLLLARRKLLGDDQRWWSVAPPGHEAVSGRKPLFQVLWQADRLEQLALDACLATPQLAAVVDYDDLCTQPTERLLNFGQRFDLSPTFSPPPALSRSARQQLSQREWDELNEVYASHFAASAQARRNAAVDLCIS